MVELYKTQDVGGVKFPTDQNCRFHCIQAKKALDKPSTLVASQAAAILGLEFPRRSVRGDHVNAFLREVVSRTRRCHRAITK